MVIRFRNIVALLMGLIAQSISAEGFQRWGRGLTERSIESLDTGETFSQLGTHPGRDLVQRIEHMLLVRRGCFFAGNAVTAGGVLGVQAEHEGFTQRGNAAGKNSLNPFPLPDLAGNLRGDGFVLLAAKVLETLPKVLLADDVKHRRLA